MTYGLNAIRNGAATVARRAGTPSTSFNHVQSSWQTSTHCIGNSRPFCAIGWAEFVNQTYDPKTQKWVSEDPEYTVARVQEEVDSTGRTILNSPKNQRNARHIKPTTYRKNLSNKIEYDRKRNQVLDLIKYIHFVKDHKNKDNW